MAYLPELHFCCVCRVYLGPDDGDGICSDCEDNVDEEEPREISLVFYDPCQTCNPNGEGRCWGHGQTVEEREGVIT
jgi:hypothetical protein